MPRILTCPACDSVQFMSVSPLTFNDEIIVKVVCGSCNEVFYLDAESGDQTAWNTFIQWIAGTSSRADADVAGGWPAYERRALHGQCADYQGGVDISPVAPVVAGNVLDDASGMPFSQVPVKGGSSAGEGSEHVGAQPARGWYKKLQQLIHMSN